MKSDSQSVKSKVNGVTQTVNEATFWVYDSLEEAAEHIGEEKALEMVNAQVKTNEMNRVRALAKGGPSKGKLREMALCEITTEQFAECAGDKAKIEQLLMETSKIIEDRMASAVVEPIED